MLFLLTCLFFKLRPLVLSKTLSHICGKLNLHILLFKVGLLTVIEMDSLIFLAKCSYLLLFINYIFIAPIQNISFYGTLHK